MVPSLTGTECGTFPPAANLDGDKGTIYKPPAPTCSSDEELNDSKTKCVKKPEPTPEPTPEPQTKDCGDGTTVTPPDKCPTTEPTPDEPTSTTTIP